MNIFRRGGQTSDQVAHVTEEMYKQNLELAERNKTLTLLRKIDEVVLGSATDVEKVTQLIANVLLDDSDFNFSAIYVTDKFKSYMTAQGMASRQRLPDSARQIIKSHLVKISLQTSQEGIFWQAIASQKVQIAANFTDFIKNIPSEDDQALKTALGVSSLFVCPLRASNQLIGVLAIGLPLNESDITPYLHNLAERLTGAVSIAVENHLLYEELQEATAKLKVQNTKLQELDKTKDEFISMASHQLGTPLTAIKGYLEMVADGDAGAVNDKQKEMIQKAFSGAQKMVYLIADMLNVSRLQTGKFIIDNKPTYLPDVVQGEVDQLTEGVKEREITLTYKKPSEFPTLNLDETKVRQVIMNFLDNALYYTPKGGKIEVILLSDENSVSYQVTDTGIGVPKAVQHHLFSKSFRADNAKKTRPDGTGLGLFMARKVIAAQGGALIFRSVEGQGSTFGFSFPRKTTEIKKAAAPVPKGDAPEATSNLQSPKKGV